MYRQGSMRLDTAGKRLLRRQAHVIVHTVDFDERFADDAIKHGLVNEAEMKSISTLETDGVEKMLKFLTVLEDKSPNIVERFRFFLQTRWDDEDDIVQQFFVFLLANDSLWQGSDKASEQLIVDKLRQFLAELRTLVIEFRRQLPADMQHESAVANRELDKTVDRALNTDPTSRPASGAYIGTLLKLVLRYYKELKRVEALVRKHHRDAAAAAAAADAAQMAEGGGGLLTGSGHAHGDGGDGSNSHRPAKYSAGSARKRLRLKMAEDEGQHDPNAVQFLYSEYIDVVNRMLTDRELTDADRLALAEGSITSRSAYLAHSLTTAPSTTPSVRAKSLPNTPRLASNSDSGKRRANNNVNDPHLTVTFARQPARRGQSTTPPTQLATGGGPMSRSPVSKLSFFPQTAGSKVIPPPPALKTYGDVGIRVVALYRIVRNIYNLRRVVRGVRGQDVLCKWASRYEAERRDVMKYCRQTHGFYYGLSQSVGWGCCGGGGGGKVVTSHHQQQQQQLEAESGAAAGAVTVERLPSAKRRQQQQQTVANVANNNNNNTSNSTGNGHTSKGLEEGSRSNGMQMTQKDLCNKKSTKNNVGVERSLSLSYAPPRSTGAATLTLQQQQLADQGRDDCPGGLLRHHSGCQRKNSLRNGGGGGGGGGGRCFACAQIERDLEGFFDTVISPCGKVAFYIPLLKESFINVVL